MGREQHLFIVRIWREAGQAAQPAPWRGSVEETPGGTRYYFSSPSDLADFIAFKLAAVSTGAGRETTSSPQPALDEMG